MQLILYPLSNYAFGIKAEQPEEDPSVNSRLQRLQKDYEQFGQRRTVEGLLVVHEHGHPHVLLLQVASAFYRLPGDYLKPGEGDHEGLQTRLQSRLGPEVGVESRGDVGTKSVDRGEDWEVVDLLAQWYRPNFEGFMYPYVPAHISAPKEVKSMYLVQLPKTKTLLVPKNMKLIAVPLFELYDNAVRYGPNLAAVPHLLSKYTFVFKE